jgi:peptidoglycan hydrolase-like protein with peptidoglycan-binding domain
MNKFRIANVATMSLAAFAALALTPQWVTSMDMEAVPTLTAEGIRTVQQALQKKGFDPGPIDGIMGPQTEQAVRKFQDAYGISTSGRIDNQTLYALGQTQLASEPKP